MGGPGRLLLGRGAELESLQAAQSSARDGQTRTVLVDGPPGVGKTTLLLVLTELLEDVGVHEVGGDELEAAVTYGVIEQLLRSILPAGDPMELLQRVPLPDPPTVGAFLVDVLSAVASDGPVVLVVDDLHWADAASLQALAFALRRLRHERVLALLAARREELHRLPEGLLNHVDGHRGMHLQLAGLAPADLAELAVGVGSGHLSELAVRRLHQHTDGIPLHARALLEELTREELEAGEPDGTLPAPKAFAALVLGRLADCTVEAERLVAATAVLGGPCTLGTAARLAGVREPMAALQSAVDARLLIARRGVQGYVVRFPHVLVRAAVYHDLGPERLAGLHLGAAELVRDESTALRHRAAASGPDGALADAAASLSRREAVRGAWSSAAEAAGLASQLSPTPGDRERLLLERIEYLLLAGDGAGLQQLLPRLDDLADDARSRYVRGRLALVTGDWAGGQRHLDEAWGICDPELEPALAARISGMAAAVLVNLGEGPATVSWARRALQLGGGATDMATDAPWLLMLGLGLSGHTSEGLEIAERMLADTGSIPMARAGALMGRGVLRLWSGDPAAATTDLAAAVAGARASGPFHVGVIAQIYLADAQFRVGDWAAASARAEAAVSAATDAGQLWFAPLMHAVAAFPQSARGRWDEAARHVDAAMQGAEALGHVAGRIWAATAAARLAHARGDHEHILEILDPLATAVDDAEVGDVRNPEIQPWVILHAEARVRVLSDASALDRLEDEWAQPGARIELARLRGLAASANGDQEAALAAFAAPVSTQELRTAPLPCALLRLEHGALLRRSGHRREAHVQLAMAHAALQRLGAHPYLERCEQQMRGCGAGNRRVDSIALRPESLTAQEHVVAELVAQGASNREAADALFITVKTVEYHLGNVYRKLHIHSRSQLASRLALIGRPTYVDAPAAH